MEMVDRVLSKGMALDRNEVKLRNRLEAVRERLNRPTEFKARLNELMALQRMQVRPANTRRCCCTDNHLTRSLAVYRCQGERRRARASLAANDMREILDVRGMGTIACPATPRLHVSVCVRWTRSG